MPYIKESCNLKVDPELKTAVQTYVLQNKRKGRRTLSELTENLWVSHLRKHGATLPAMTK